MQTSQESSAPIFGEKFRWCKNCDFEVSEKICPVCGAETVEEIPTEVFWCEKCSVPVITSISAENKNVCPLCSGKTKQLAADIRPVFPEEKLLLAVLLNKAADFFMEKSLWASGSRYYVDGKAFNLSTRFFAEADADLIAKKMSVATDVINYNFFDNDIEKFISANRYRFFEIKDEAISFVQRTAKNFPEENIVISFSGGKDSTAVADIVVKALNNPSLVHIFGNTTLEFPMTLEYAVRYRENHSFAIFQTAVNNEQNFFSVCEDIGPPARMMRWCCSMFKTGPISRIINSLYRNQKILTFYGIRKAESVARSKYNRVEGESESIKIRQQTVASPIFLWKDIDVWLYILSEKIDFNSAYRLGYDRVGCWCCPNNNQRAQFLSRIYMPVEYKNWRRFLVDFAAKIGKPDPEVYVDSGKWKARQGGNGLISANDVKLKFTNCTTEEHAKIYQLNKNFDDKFLNLFVPFGKVAPELGRKILHETLILDCKTNVPILSISPFNQGTAVKIKTLNVADHDSLQRMASYQVKKFNACRKCLKCEALCQAGAISVGEEYYIDSTKCIHCKKCVTAKYLTGGCMMEKFLHTK